MRVPQPTDPPGDASAHQIESTPVGGASSTPEKHSPSRPPTVRHESEVHGFITRTFFKNGPPGRVGIESEWFVLDRLVAEYRRAGLRMAGWWTDPDGDYAVSRAVPQGR